MNQEHRIARMVKDNGIVCGIDNIIRCPSLTPFGEAQRISKEDVQPLGEVYIPISGRYLTIFSLL